jgi:ankyrin repeat protein
VTPGAHDDHINMCLNFLRDTPKVECASQILLNNTPWGRQRTFSAIHMVAFFGLEGVLDHMLDEKVEADERDGGGRTPLSYAAENGHEAAVKLLLERGGVDTNSKDEDFGQTPLQFAARNGKDAVVKLLLTRTETNVNLGDRFYQTPLLLAARNGHEAVVKLLLGRNDIIDVNSTSVDGWTPLRLAIVNGRDEVVKLLLARHDIDAGTYEATTHHTQPSTQSEPLYVDR